MFLPVPPTIVVTMVRSVFTLSSSGSSMSRSWMDADGGGTFCSSSTSISISSLLTASKEEKLVTVYSCIMYICVVIKGVHWVLGNLLNSILYRILPIIKWPSAHSSWCINTHPVFTTTYTILFILFYFIFWKNYRSLPFFEQIYCWLNKHYWMTLDIKLYYDRSIYNNKKNNPHKCE